MRQKPTSADININPSSTKTGLWSWMSSWFNNPSTGKEYDIHDSVLVTRHIEKWASEQKDSPSTLKSIKSILLGPAMVGKTSLTMRIAQDKFSAEYSNCTIGTSFMRKTVTVLQKPVRVDLWDTAGQQRYRSIAPMYYRGACIILAVYDISNRESFEGVKYWLEEVKRHAAQLDPRCVIFMLGNKDDLENERQISAEEAQEYAQQNGYLFCEVSAKTGHNVKEVVRMAAERVIIGVQTEVLVQYT